jgi:phosphoadenosine phosphosulfate reductase
MRPSYLGKILLRWCDSCHTPVMSGQCACGAFTREVPVTPPGDARPAFPYDISLVNRVFSEHFGASLIPEGHLALMNKVPDPDRMEEVIVGGGIAGSIRYIAEQRKWEPIPRPEAAGLIRPLKRYVVIADGAIASVRDEGASVLAPGLESIEGSVKAGDEVFILTREGECVGVGRAKVDAATAETMGRGPVVRTRRNIKSHIVPGKATWDDAVGANAVVLDKVEALGIGFIRDVHERNQLPVNVSFSGGKDSLATLLLAMKALGRVPILFADTGLEFPETYECIEKTCEYYDLDIIRTSGEKEFWETLAREGPPAINYRWCCKTCKLDPVKRVIIERWGECLSFIGQRKYESSRRAVSKRVWRNSKVPNQLSAAPVHHWTAMHVWLYIFREKGPYNILYEQGLDRIGCFMCPSSDIAVLEQIRERYPALWAHWTARLEEWREKTGFPREWTTEERWRKREPVAADNGTNPEKVEFMKTDEEDSNC